MMSPNWQWCFQVIFPSKIFSNCLNQLSWILRFSHQMTHFAFISPKVIVFAPNFCWIEKMSHQIFLWIEPFETLSIFYSNLTEKPTERKSKFDKSCPGLRQGPVDCPDWLLGRYGRAVFQIKVRVSTRQNL